MARWIQLLVTGITVGIYCSSLWGTSRYTALHASSMAQGAFVMFGGFFAYSFLSESGYPTGWPKPDPSWVS